MLLCLACQKNTGDIGRGNNTLPITLTCTSGVDCPVALCGNQNCDVGESCASCPQDCTAPGGRACQRVGMVYSVWQQPAAYAAALAVQQNITLLSVEDVLRSRQEVLNGNAQGYALADVYNNAAVAQAAGNFYYQHRPQDGYYCIYHHREPTDINYHAATDDGAPYDCVTYEATLRKQADMLVTAGVDFVAVDMTHAATYSATWDIGQLRPFEVLVDTWVKLRKSGVATPDIAAWQTLSGSGDDPNQAMSAMVLNIYNNPAYDGIFLRDAATHRKIFFYPSMAVPDANAVAALEANAGRNDIISEPMWVGQQANGAWSYFSTCHVPVMFDDTPCAQTPTFNTRLGSQLAVSPSYQTGYASLPFQAPGVYGGLTLRKQFAQALAQQPNYLLLSMWNEQIAQPFSETQGPSMGLETDATAVSQGFIGLYGVEFSHDLEPSVEYGTLLYDIVQSCLLIYRSGATACTDPQSLCCRGGKFSDTYTFYNGAQGPFGLYVTNPNNDRSKLNLCVSGTTDYFLSPSPTCESATFSQALGFVAKTKGGETLRALRRCFSQATGHLYSLTGACPSSTVEELILGYVR